MLLFQRIAGKLQGPGAASGVALSRESTAGVGERAQTDTFIFALWFSGRGIKLQGWHDKIANCAEFPIPHNARDLGHSIKLIDGRLRADKRK